MSNLTKATPGKAVRVPSIRNGFRIGVLVYGGPDGLWYWRGMWVDAFISGPFQTRTEAVDDCGLYCGDRMLWPEIVGPEDLEPAG